ncbi:MAG: AAA family ATPase, partial [Mariprofundales bacterium]
MQRKKLPIGIQTFSEIIQNDYCYVDKTGLINRLTISGKYYFLSRPRRFGKSLLVSTLKSLFAGEQDLFAGLAIVDEWDWSRQHPVIHISFGGGLMNNPEVLENILQSQMQEHAEDYQIKLTATLASTQFRQLIRALHSKFNQQVVLLIDEYDKPILDNIVSDRNDVAIAVRDTLKGFYAVIKDSDAYLRFVLLTGVSKFSKVSLFSGLNNLQDITLDKRFSSLCGYTQTELAYTFAEWLDGVDMDKLRLWYNGYNFAAPSKKHKVYNPFDVLLYLDTSQFKNYWFETGSPSFLIRIMEQRQFFIPNLTNIEADESLLSTFDVNNIELEPLLFQTGYLTIESTQQIAGDIIYKLTTPNYEVWHSLHKSILNMLVQRGAIRQKNSLALYRCLMADN